MADSQFTSTALGAIRLAQENAARLDTAMWAVNICCWGWPARSTAPLPVLCVRLGQTAIPSAARLASGLGSECPPAPSIKD